MKINKKITIWLLICLLIVIVNMLVSGISRIRESGLAITDFKPVTSLILPYNEEQFAKELDSYKAIPQFAKLFANMEVGEFKVNYQLEYFAYLSKYALLIAFVPVLAFFSFHKILHWQDALRLAGAFTGFILIYYLAMDLPPYYRPSFNLALRHSFFAFLLWQILSFSYPKHDYLGGFELPIPNIESKICSALTLIFVFLQIVSGGTVSSLHAGLSYNSFPFMDGQLVPEGIFETGSLQFVQNIFTDATTSQFIHRLLAYCLTIVIPTFWLIDRNNPHIAHLLPILFSIFVIQFLLGVLTLLFSVPIPLASLHQANALLLFGIAVTIVHRLFMPIKVIIYEGII